MSISTMGRSSCSAPSRCCDDDEHTLAARILEQERQAYTEAIAIVIAGNYEIAGRRVVARASGAGSAQG